MRLIIAASVGMLFASGALAQHASHDETAYGRAAAAANAKRTVRIDMSDQMRFMPAQLTVKRGETVRFIAANKGQVMHEMVLGTMAELKAHAEEMKKESPGTQHHHEPNMTHVAPGASGQLVWQFTRAGEFYYACLIPGHFDAGMIGKLTVVP